MTINEIAAMAGVSKAAVSRYLNNGYLSAEKREAIRAVIEKTGYRPSVRAQVLRTRKSKMIGVILPKIDSFSVSKVVAGIDEVLEKAGYQILLADTHNDPARELEYLDVFDDQHVDGLILLGSVLTARHMAAFKKSKVPLVVVGQQVTGFSCVCHDDYHAFYELTKMLLDRGCRQMGFVAAPPQDKAVGAERRRGYCDAVCDGGLPALAEQIVTSDFTIQGGYNKAKELWERFGPLDAIVCATDRTAIGTAGYLHEQGIAVPDGVMVTGQGDSTLSKVCRPSITTLRYAYEESGSAAAALLLESLEKPDSPPKEIKLGYQIVEQESTRR